MHRRPELSCLAILASIVSTGCMGWGPSCDAGPSEADGGHSLLAQDVPVDPDCRPREAADGEVPAGVIDADSLFPAAIRISPDGEVARIRVEGEIAELNLRVDLRTGVVSSEDGLSLDPRRRAAGRREPFRCRVAPATDLEVRALISYFPSASNPPPPLLVRVTRHSTGETVFDLRPEELPFGQADEMRDPCCAPGGAISCPGACSRGAIPPAGCRRVEVVSETDGFCHETFVP